MLKEIYKHMKKVKVNMNSINNTLQNEDLVILLKNSMVQKNSNVKKIVKPKLN